MKILVTGGAGFIGSALVRFLISETEHKVFNLDKLTYAGNLSSLSSVSSSKQYSFLQGDICDRKTVEKVFNQFQPDIVMHLAAESHVDRSIDGPTEFIHTNIVGTSVLLEVSRSLWNDLSSERKKNFRFHHISTDEVYGSLESTGLFTEDTPYDPASPYSASKAGSDHLVRAWNRTFGLPTLITNCSNNYGPYQFPEKLIPLIILNALDGKPLPVYGDGQQIRDWLFIDDHISALYKVVTEGIIGETYNIGGHNEKTNLEVVKEICRLLNDICPERSPKDGKYSDLITFVKDRPGHDIRYAIDASKIKNELDWEPVETFETGLRKTVEWYLQNSDWCEDIQTGNYQRDRLGELKT